MHTITPPLLKTLLFLTSLLMLSSASANNWDGIFDYAQYHNAKISPDGEHLAVSVLIGKKRAIVFLERETMKVVGNVRLPGSYQTGNYHWVNNERIVIEPVRKTGWQEQLVYHGELYAANIDGTQSTLIYGYQAGERQTGTRVKKKKSTRGFAEIVDILPDDKKHILISSQPASHNGEKTARLRRLNVYSGVMKHKSAQAPLPRAKFITNSKGKLTALAGIDEEGMNQVYLRINDKWEHVSKEIVTNNVVPIATDSTGDYLYTLDNKNQNTISLFKLGIKDKSYKAIFSDKKVDIEGLVMNTQGNQIYAVRLEDGYASYVILDNSLEEAKIFKNLLKAFPYSRVNITSRTENGDMYIVSVSSDVDAGKIYLFNKKANSMKFLFSYMPKFKSSQFAQVEPVNFKSRDGEPIQGYFTAARNNAAHEIAPLVVLVHGGPHNARDYWSFNTEVQYLALNGYSVLQVNFRGSGGYGTAFQEAGYRVWGTTIQQDIYDGLQWLISEKKADPSKVCIMGASFGAYSSIQSTILTPDTYKCAIANAGVYDLEQLYEIGDVPESLAGVNSLKIAIGEDKEELRNMSPIHRVNDIKAPILLAHGKMDERTPFKHVEDLRSALDKAGKPYEWFVIDKEGHGFYNPENQKTYMRKVVKFLDQHIN